MVDGTPGAAAPAPLGDVLRTVGRELADLGRMASNLQAVLGPTEPWLGRDGAVLRRLQSLDALTQSLHGVAEFLQALAPTVPPHWSCDAARAAEGLTLSDLAGRLAQRVADAAALQADEAGEFELFGS
jgi:hypothetical protein